MPGGDGGAGPVAVLRRRQQCPVGDAGSRGEAAGEAGSGCPPCPRTPRGTGGAEEILRWRESARSPPSSRRHPRSPGAGPGQGLVALSGSADVSLRPRSGSARAALPEKLLGSKARNAECALANRTWLNNVCTVSVRSGLMVPKACCLS